jgi:hypothetical protein
MTQLLTQREIVDALEEELRVGTKPLKFTVKDVQSEAAGIFKVFIDPFAITRRGLDESLEGSAALVAWASERRCGCAFCVGGA